MKIIKADYYNSPYLGVFCKANDNIAITPKKMPEYLENIIKEELDVDLVKTSMATTGLIGIFSAFNNKRIIIPDLLYKEEVKVLEDYFSDVIIIDEKFSAIGNLVTMNDHGIACSPLIKDSLKEATGLKVAGTDLIGSVVFSNNAGFVAHIETKEEEIKELEKVLKVKGGIGTVNFGDPYTSSGIIGNKKGLIVGNKTSGPELARLDEIFSQER